MMNTHAIFETLLNWNFAVTRRERTADGQGGWVISYTAVGNVRGRLRPMGAAEQVVAKAEGQRVTHKFYTLAAENVLPGDRLTLGALVVDVLAVLEPSQADHHYEIHCEARQVEVQAAA